MKKRTHSRLKAAFQTVAAGLAQVTGENHASAMNSAGVFYDNLSSGLTRHNLKNLKEAVLSRFSRD
jgi:hypothetical protein